MKFEMIWHAHYIRFPCGLCSRMNDKTGVSVNLLDDEGETLIEDICVYCVRAANGGTLQDKLAKVIEGYRKYNEIIGENAIMVASATDWPTYELIMGYEQSEVEKAYGKPLDVAPEIDAALPF